MEFARAIALAQFDQGRLLAKGHPIATLYHDDEIRTRAEDESALWRAADLVLTADDLARLSDEVGRILAVAERTRELVVSVRELAGTYGKQPWDDQRATQQVADMYAIVGPSDPDNFDEYDDWRELRGRLETFVLERGIVTTPQG